jgi:phosphate transport system substrate-binding protein
MVGSSTVYPFAIIMSGLFEKINVVLPTIESNGSGGGFKLFCEGVGDSYPDIANSSRTIKSQELKDCEKNGVSPPLEVIIGYDAITLIHNKNLTTFNLTTQEIFLALAEFIPDINNNLIKNPYKLWSDINKNLPKIPIKVLGPPSSSGTKDSFLELAFKKGCNSLHIKDENICTSIRQDGAWIISGEDDHLIITKVSNSSDLIGILGYNFYIENKDKLQAISINSITATEENILSNKYTLSRPLYMYFKTEHILLEPTLLKFLNFILANNILGFNGYLAEKGLIPITEKEKSTTLTSISNIQIK